jgi:hypothetical protein
MTPDIREQFLGMSERYRGADPKVQMDKLAMKVLRHNRPLLGPSTRTVESIPKGKAILYARLEEDVDSDGLPLETRIYDDSARYALRHAHSDVVLTSRSAQKASICPVQASYACRMACFCSAVNLRMVAGLPALPAVLVSCPAVMLPPCPVRGIMEAMAQLMAASRKPERLSGHPTGNGRNPKGFSRDDNPGIHGGGKP